MDGDDNDDNDGDDDLEDDVNADLGSDLSLDELWPLCVVSFLEKVKAEEAFSKKKTADSVVASSLQSVMRN